MPRPEAWPALILAELSRPSVAVLVEGAEAGKPVHEIQSDGTLSEHRYVVCRMARELRRAAGGEGSLRWDELKERVQELRRLSELPQK